MIPKDPAKFKGELSYYYIEDENGEQPASFHGRISYVSLDITLKDGLMILTGVPSPYKAQCLDLRLNNHNYGMCFSVACKNKHDHVTNKTLWRRAVNKDLLHTFFSTAQDQLVLQGDAPEVAHSKSGTITIDVLKRKHDFHVTKVSIEITLDYYDAFIRRYQEDEEE